MNNQEFINKIKIIHNNKYDYSKVKYTGARNKITIICKEHGEFEQRASAHSNGQGCPKCALKSPNRYKMDLNHFIKKSNKIHNNKYDYSKSQYKSSNHKITIICKEHGEFEQRASAHSNGQGCPKCNSYNKISKKEFIKRANIIHNNKYDYSIIDYKSLNHKITIICPKHGEFEQKASGHIINKNGCPKCGHQSMKNSHSYTNEKFKELALKIHDKYDYSKVNYKNNRSKIIIKCPKHGEFEQIPMDHLAGCGCPKCAGTNLQNEIFNFVKSINDNNEIIINDRKIIHPLELDIYIPNKQIAIEVNGLYWHSYNHIETTEEKNKHYNKYELCDNNNIQLIQINENEWRDKQNIIKSIIKSKFGILNKLHARKCTIIDVDNEQYKNFANKNHLQGFKSASIKYGLKYDNKLVAVMSFNRHNKYEWEITRFANKLNIAIVGGASKLFKHFLKENNPKQILTYADRRYSNGGLYKKLGFKLDNITKPNYCYTKKGHVFSRQQFMKHKLKNKLKNFNPELTEAENMFNNGYRRLWDAGNFKFIIK